MKQFLMTNFNTDQIERVNVDELKRLTEDKSVISKIKYRQ